MSTGKIKGEDHHACREVKAERDQLKAEVLRLRVAIAKAAMAAEAAAADVDAISVIQYILYDALDCRHTAGGRAI